MSAQRRTQFSFYILVSNFPISFRHYLHCVLHIHGISWRGRLFLSARCRMGEIVLILPTRMQNELMMSYICVSKIKLTAMKIVESENVQHFCVCSNPAYQIRFWRWMNCAGSTFWIEMKWILFHICALTFARICGVKRGRWTAMSAHSFYNSEIAHMFSRWINRWRKTIMDWIHE